MKALATLLLTATLAISADVALAGNGSAACPPGLAKKNPPCVPPGQVGKSDNRYQRGEVIEGDYWVIRDPGRYRLDRTGNYAVLGDYVYQIDPQTRKVLNLIGAIADLAQ